MIHGKDILFILIHYVESKYFCINTYIILYLYKYMIILNQKRYEIEDEKAVTKYNIDIFNCYISERSNRKKTKCILKLMFCNVNYCRCYKENENFQNYHFLLFLM